MRRVTLKAAQKLGGMLRSWAYNCVDCVATRQVLDAILPAADAGTLRTYSMQRSVQNAAFAMGTRGFLIDQTLRASRVHQLKLECGKLQRALAKNPQIIQVWDKLQKVTGKCKKSKRKDGKHSWQPGIEDTPERRCTQCGTSRFTIAPFSATSPDQVKHLFYDLLGCKKQYNKDKKLSVDEDCLDRIGKGKKVAALVQTIKSIRDLSKQTQLLNARLRDGYYTTSFNVGTALTDRWSSNKDAFGCGGNVQNIPERHRDIFIARPGKKLVYADLKQAESKTISYISGDPAYMQAHEGDTHTFVCHLMWDQGLTGYLKDHTTFVTLDPWPKDEKEWAKFAKAHFPEWDNKDGHDYRFQTKAIQHGSNLALTPFGLAMQKHMPLKAAIDGQSRYFRKFPGIRSYQRWVRAKVEKQEPIINPLGVRFLLYGRPWDEHTYKQGLALLPQSVVCNIINLAAQRIWTQLDPHRVQLLAQVHDALVMEVDEDDEAVLSRINELMTVPIPVTDIQGWTRTMTIEAQLAWGWNWKHASKDNPRGLTDVHF